MSFSRAQQGVFRPLVTRAWAAHAKAEGLDLRDRKAKDAWYRGELLACLGRDTTKEAGAGRDYETVMAHFEVFVGGEFYWNLRVHQGDTRRLQHALQAVCAKYEFDDAYARSVAARVLKWQGNLSSLYAITNPGDLAKVRVALLIQGRRVAKRTEAALAAPQLLPAAEVEPDNCPF